MYHHRYQPPANKSSAHEERQDVIFRKVRGILNKITPETFDKLSRELLHVGLDTPRTLKGVIYLLFEKALKDPKYSSLYAKLCQELSEKAPNFEPEPGPNTFCKFLISKCEDEFERRRKATEDFESKNELTDDEFEQKAIAKQKMLGNIKFICELGRKRLLQEEILHECIRGLLSKKKERTIQDQAQDLECLCQIMKTVGNLLDTQASKNLMNQYFDRMGLFSKKNELPSRIRFMLKDVIDLRNNKWRPRPFQREDNAPQTLSKLREEAGYPIERYGNGRSMASFNELASLHGANLSFLDDGPSFTTSSDHFGLGSTYMPMEHSFMSSGAETFSKSLDTRSKQRDNGNATDVKSSTLMSSDKSQGQKVPLLSNPPSNSLTGSEKNSPNNNVQANNLGQSRPYIGNQHKMATNNGSISSSVQQPVARTNANSYGMHANPPTERRIINVDPERLAQIRDDQQAKRFDERRDPRDFRDHDRRFDSRDNRTYNTRYNRDFTRDPPPPPPPSIKPLQDFNRDTFNKDLRKSTHFDPIGARQMREREQMRERAQLRDRDQIRLEPRGPHLEQTDFNRRVRNNSGGDRYPMNQNNHNRLQRPEPDVYPPVVANDNPNMNWPRRDMAEDFIAPRFRQRQYSSEQHTPVPPHMAPLKAQPRVVDSRATHNIAVQPYINSNQPGLNHRGNVDDRAPARFDRDRFDSRDRSSDNVPPPRRIAVNDAAVTQPSFDRSRMNQTNMGPPNNGISRYSRNEFNANSNINNYSHQKPSVHQHTNNSVQTVREMPSPLLTTSISTDEKFSLRPSHNPLINKVVTSSDSKESNYKDGKSSEQRLGSDNNGLSNVSISLTSIQPVSRYQPEAAQAVPPPSALPAVKVGDIRSPVIDSFGNMTLTNISSVKSAAKDYYVNKFNEIVAECFNATVSSEIMVSTLQKIKELKVPKNYQPECLVGLMKDSILKTDTDREMVSHLFGQLVPSSIESSSLMNAFKSLFIQMEALEVETPKVKSHVAGILSRAISDGLVSLEDVKDPLEGGKHHPLFLLCLQKLEKIMGKAWVNEKFTASKIDLINMLPEVDRTKDRLASILRDRCLGFLYPMLTIEPDLWAQIEKDATPGSIYRWIKENVDSSLQSSPPFAYVLFTCLLRYIHLRVSEKSSQEESSQNSPSTATIEYERELLTKYHQILQAILSDKKLQLATLYSLQSFYYGLGFPKGM